jgi:predicted 3-demethylubiquinone-9 3-methyltransferase (glyoxalase superfamily)
MQKVTPFLWFDGNLEEAVNFYTTVFPNAHVVSKNPATATFVIEGQEFMALNGGPRFKFSEAVWFFIHCETQAEIDYFWEHLTDGGVESQCGWLKDKFGLSWQVVPTLLGQYLGGPDRARAQRVMQAMLTMTKFDIAALEAAYKDRSF